MLCYLFLQPCILIVFDVREHNPNQELGIPNPSHTYCHRFTVCAWIVVKTYLYSLYIREVPPPPPTHTHTPPNGPETNLLGAIKSVNKMMRNGVFYFLDWTAQLTDRKTTQKYT